MNSSAVSALRTIAITMGDPTGIGPEIIVKAVASGATESECRLIVLGRPAIFEHAARVSNLDLNIVSVASLDGWKERTQSSVREDGRPTLWCLPTGSEDADHAIRPEIDPRGGQAALDCLLGAADLALEKQVDAIVTAPLHKVALYQAGHDWPGHTELLAHRCGVKEHAMMLYLPPGKARHGGAAGFGVIHVTLHMALRDVFAHLTIQAIDEKIRLADSVFRRIRKSLSLEGAPRIAVAALNPHAGESGRFGDEEATLIAPAVRESQQAGFDVVGPLPVDTLMPRAVDGAFDAVVAMYHDQGHIALKLLDMFDAVNVTLGLPIVRTSVAHGTAHDIAWRNRAEASGMIQAILTAGRLSHSL